MSDPWRTYGYRLDEGFSAMDDDEQEDVTPPSLYFDGRPLDQVDEPITYDKDCR